MSTVKSLISDISGSIQVLNPVEEAILKSLIKQDAIIPKPEIIFGLGNATLMTKKSISTLIGKAKSGKTTVTAWIVSQTIKSGLNTLWIDTEQGLYYGSRTQHWILSMSGLIKSDHLQFYDLKIYPPSLRIEIIEEIIKAFRPGLLVIDGIRDLVFDINSPEESTTIIGDIMRWAEEYDCHILNILHQNKGNEHARGHLGTEMINKAETVIKVEQNEEKLIVCTPEYTRSEAFEPFAFDRDDKGVPQIIEGFAGKVATVVGQSTKKQIDPTDPAFNTAHSEIVDKVFSASQFLKYSDLIKNIRYYFQLHGVNFGTSKAEEFATHYQMTGRIWINPYVKGYAKYEKNPQYTGEVYQSQSITTKPDTEEPPF